MPLRKVSSHPCQAEELIRLLSLGPSIQFLCKEIFDLLEHFGTIGIFLQMGTKRRPGKMLSLAHTWGTQTKAKGKSYSLEMRLDSTHWRPEVSNALWASVSPSVTSTVWF